MRVSGITAVAIVFAPAFFAVCMGSSPELDFELRDLQRWMSKTPPVEEIEVKVENPDADEVDSFNWYSVWGGGLHSRLDDLFSALEQRPREPTEEAQSPQWLRIGEPDDADFTIAMIGDSTMRMQADAFSWLLASRKTDDGRSLCQCKKNPRVVCECLRPGDQGEGNIGLHMTYYNLWEECVNSTVVADFVYFGCGLHVLQLHPERKLNQVTLDSWVHYERKLEEGVLAYRSMGKDRRSYLGETFMSTHSVSAEKLTDPMLGLLSAYTSGDPDVLAVCYEKVNRIDPLHDGWESEFPAEEICTRGSLSDEGVIHLNDRAEAVMIRLGVPVVPSYEITRGQAWATPITDGRHYPALIPEELAHFLAKVNLALRHERLLDARSTTEHDGN